MPLADVLADVLVCLSLFLSPPPRLLLQSTSLCLPPLFLYVVVFGLMCVCVPRCGRCAPLFSLLRFSLFISSLSSSFRLGLGILADTDNSLPSLCLRPQALRRGEGRGRAYTRALVRA